ncbi:MAG: GAF domain-containing protein [Hyphomicrobiales bacterium]|nr:GAF domain-containing protein [Hyphomicrobiales bacterium]
MTAVGSRPLQSRPPLEFSGNGVERPPAASRYFPDPKLVEAALQSADVGIWSWDLASDRVMWSSNLEGIHRLPQGSFDGSFEFVKNDVHPEDRPHFQAAVEEARRTGTPQRVLYRLPPRPDGEEYWIESIATAAFENGEAVGLFGICRDVTERVRLQQELRQRARQQEAVARLGERALVESDLQAFFDFAVNTIGQMLGVELVKILELAPADGELFLRAGVGWEPSLVGTAHLPRHHDSPSGKALALGRPVIIEDLPADPALSGASFLREQGVISGLCCPIAGRDGRAYGVLGAHTRKRRRFSESDVSFLAAVANVLAGAIQRRQLDLRQAILIRELRHRSGNLFSQLLALFSQTAKSANSLEDLVPKYEARVLALANGHRLVTEGGWKSAALTELLNTLLAPYLDQVTFRGPDLYLEPEATFGLSIAIHELTTNAGRFGSLSAACGRVELTWRVERTTLGLTLLLQWRERGGPPPGPRRQSGFGSRLINMVIERSLNGTVATVYSPDGLDVTLTVPLTHERWPVTPSRGAAPLTLDTATFDQDAGGSSLGRQSTISWLKAKSGGGSGPHT